MSQTTFVAETTLATIVCGCCGGVYAIEERFRKQCYEHGTSWRCPYPNCNVWWGYTGNETDRLRRQLEDERTRTARAEESARRAASQAGVSERRARAYKGQVTKVKRRVAAGVCPCCNRTFQNLARHMHGQHPDYVTEPAP